MLEDEVVYPEIRSFYERWDWKRECFICCCRCCGDIFIASCIMRCPCCDSGDIVVVPFRDHKHFNLHWLGNHGFPFIKNRLEVDNVMRSEEEVRNIKNRFEEELESLVDVEQKKYNRIAIMTLEMVLDE